MKFLGRLIVICGFAFFLAQLVRPNISQAPTTAEIQAPPQIRQILQKDCYSCHSNERRLAWFDQIAPASWLVAHDVKEARAHLNFSTLGAQPVAVQRATLFEAVNQIQLGAMPLPQFRMLHPEARVTPEELAALKAYLAPFAPGKPTAIPSAPGPGPVVGEDIAPENIAPELNGLAFLPDYKTWQPLSTTDRGDNHTFRVIAGNAIAVKAIADGNIQPWPDGTAFAKITSTQVISEDGVIRPGRFAQVELMVKDAKKYESTVGWGFGRWKGDDLKPYGKDAHFDRECVSCHLPVRGNDYVYTMPIPAALPASSSAAHAALTPQGASAR